MTVRVAVRPAERLESHCLAALLARHGLRVEVTDDLDPPADVVVELVWSLTTHGHTRSEDVLYCLLGSDHARATGLATGQPAVDGLTSAEQLVERVRAAAGDRAAPHATAAATPLTPREREVAELVAEGLSNEVIARRLHISGHTARTHVQRVLAKLGAQRRSTVAAMVRNGSLDPPPGVAHARAVP